MTALATPKPATPKLSVQEYFELEQRSEVRHEFVDGTLIQMPGGTRIHGIIVKNLVKTLDDVSIERGCELQQLELKLRTTDTRYRYMDIMISCNPGSEPYFLEHPCFVAEVTSGTTADVDSGKKLEEYLNLPSLERYAIISQVSRFVVVFRRENGLRTFETFDGSGEFEIPCLGVSLSLDSIYANLEI